MFRIQLFIRYLYILIIVIITSVLSNTGGFYLTGAVLWFCCLHSFPLRGHWSSCKLQKLCFRARHSQLDSFGFLEDQLGKITFNSPDITLLCFFISLNFILKVRGQVGAQCGRFLVDCCCSSLQTNLTVTH